MTAEKDEMDIHAMVEAAEELPNQPPARKRRKARTAEVPEAPIGEQAPQSTGQMSDIDFEARVLGEMKYSRDALSERRGYSTAPECVATMSIVGVQAVVIGGTQKPRGGWRLALTGKLSSEQVDSYLGSSTIFVYLPDSDDVPNKDWIDRAVALGVPVVVPKGMPLPKADCGVEVDLEGFYPDIPSTHPNLAQRVKIALRQIERDYDSYVASCLGA
jgi:hypothetical protein